MVLFSVLISFVHMHGAIDVPYFVGQDGVGGSIKIKRPRSGIWQNFGRRWIGVSGS